MADSSDGFRLKFAKPKQTEYSRFMRLSDDERDRLTPTQLAYYKARLEGTPAITVIEDILARRGAGPQLEELKRQTTWLEETFEQNQTLHEQRMEQTERHSKEAGQWARWALGVSILSAFLAIVATVQSCAHIEPQAQKSKVEVIQRTRTAQPSRTP